MPQRGGIVKQNDCACLTASVLGCRVVHSARGRLGRVRSLPTSRLSLPACPGEGRMVTLEALLSQLHGVRSVGSGYFARCPCHEERTASLSITLHEGYPYAHCFGCGARTREVLVSLGLTPAGRPEPATAFERALAMGRRQEGYRHRQAYWLADLLREFEGHVRAIRRLTAELGEDDEGWAIMAEVAELERRVGSVSA